MDLRVVTKWLRNVVHLWTCAFLCALGCSGVIGPSSSAPDRPDPPAPTPALPGLTDAPELRLLAPRQYVASVHDLLGIVVDEREVPPLRTSAGHGGIASAQRVTYDAADRYYELASRTALTAMSRDTSCTGETCRDFVRQLARDAFRGDDGVADVAALLDDPDAGDSLEERALTAVIEILSSPRFLYRIERPLDERLTDEALATRLSFLVWETGPDESLLRDARVGTLRTPAGRVAALDRMLADERARRGLRGFVFDWMGVFEDRIASKSETVLSGTSSELPRVSRLSLERTIDEALGRPDARFVDVLTATTTYVDHDLARLFEVELPEMTETLEPRSPDPDRWLGVLTHPSVLAAHTKESGASPFPIGKFILENLLCEVIPAPPPVPEVDSETTGAQTLREELEALTAHGVCQECHRRIGPAGFAFLPFDPIGRHRPTDGGGRAWDTAGLVPREDGWLAFDDAPGLARRLAEEPEVRACVARRLFRWTFGRFESDQDAALVAELESVATRDEGTVRRLLETLVASEAFASRGESR